MMGVIFPESRPPKRFATQGLKHKTCKNINEIDSSKLSMGELVYCVSDLSMYLFNGATLNKLSMDGDEHQNKYIRCEYCDSELEDKYINCPNCGAPLRRNKWYE